MFPATGNDLRGLRAKPSRRNRLVTSIPPFPPLRRERPARHRKPSAAKADAAGAIGVAADAVVASATIKPHRGRTGPKGKQVEVPRRVGPLRHPAGMQ
jgi:hypothetical protein